MSLAQYIREEQEFLIYIHASADEWEVYEPDRHGTPESIHEGYVVAYLNGEVLEDCANTESLPPGIDYIKVFKKNQEVMPQCVDDARVKIQHEPSPYHPSDGHYCTRIRNMGSVPFKVRRFAAFRAIGRQYRISTVSNSWFTEDQFRNWFNQKTEWLAPGDEAVDQDNYGSGNGYWVFEIEFDTGEIVTVKDGPFRWWKRVLSPAGCSMLIVVFIFIVIFRKMFL